MPSVNFYLKNPNAKTPQLIYLFFSFNGKRLKYSTRESIKPSQWDINNQKAKSNQNLNDYLKYLSNFIESEERKLRTLGEKVTPNILRDLLDLELKLKKTIKHDLFSYISEYIKQMELIKKGGTIKGYRNTQTHLIDFKKHRKRNFDFEDINMEFYNEFTNFLTEKKEFSVNTVGKQIKNLKVFLNEATEAGYNKSLEYKSRKFKVVSEEADSIYLNEDELKEMFLFDLEKIPKYERIRDLFIVACYTGLRFSDFSTLNSANITKEKIKVKTQKMNKYVEIPLHRYVKAVLRGYRKEYENSLPPAISNQKMNEYLKEIGKMVGINQQIEISYYKGIKRIKEYYPKYELITTHTARRSFATNLYLSGLSTLYIMAITGHTTEKAFLKYIKVTPEQHAQKLKEHWLKIETEKRKSVRRE